MMQAASRKKGIPRIRLCPVTQLIRRNEGGALIELAFLLLFFFPLMIYGVVEFGGLAYDYIEVCNAAHAGASYAAQYYIANSKLATQAEVVNAAESDSPELQTALKSGTTFPATPMAIGCTGSDTAATTVTTSTTVPTCTGTEQPYIQVTVTVTVVPMIVSPFFPASWSSFTMNDVATMNLVQ